MAEVDTSSMATMRAATSWFWRNQCRSSSGNTEFQSTETYSQSKSYKGETSE
jgi:hypothetical protein